MIIYWTIIVSTNFLITLHNYYYYMQFSDFRIKILVENVRAKDLWELNKNRSIVLLRITVTITCLGAVILLWIILYSSIIMTTR